MINVWMAAEERRSATRREEPRRDVTRFIVKRGLDLARVYEDCKGGGGRADKSSLPRDFFATCRWRTNRYTHSLNERIVETVAIVQGCTHFHSLFFLFFFFFHFSNLTDKSVPPPTTLLHTSRATFS